MGSVPGEAELLREDVHTRVVRLHLRDGRSVIRKELRGPDAEVRASREAAILRRLSGVANIVHLAPDQPDARAIMLEDIRGVLLSRVATPLEPARMVGLMLELARVVAAIHEHGVVHGDINPGNILLADDGRFLYLIDFALATTFTELRPEFTHPEEIVGTLPYLAPEQTGRTRRSMDRRADLYGLGATMYELATGRPPFGTGDPLRLIHDHLALAVTPPAEVNPAVPPGLSEIITHLLAKEPDHRYQTAEGLAHDLERVRDGAQQLRVGEDDLAARMTEPARLVGRDHEIAVLRAALEGVRSGQSRGVVISGESGVGKSALIDELRPMVTDVDGWFTSGRFDGYRRDPEHDAVAQALRGLARLLLAEPEDELAGIRQRLLEVLGRNAGLVAAVTPEFATLLKVVPDPGDPLTAELRTHQSAVEILRAVASRTRPVVFAVDDLQWGGAGALGLLDELLSGDEEVAGLLTVAAYREGEVADGHPLVGILARWARNPSRPQHLRIANLSEAELADMVGEMLHASTSAAEDLEGAIFGPTHGNPYETVELLNGLRREGVLRPSGSAWRWDRRTLERHLARENVAGLVEARVDAMPVPTRRLLEAMACLGGEVQLSVLSVATGLDAATLQQRLGPALDEGLLVIVARGEGVQFQHDRLRDVVLNRVAPRRLRAMRLGIARRLATRPELSTSAAEQYQPVVDALHEQPERQCVTGLLRGAAAQRMLIGESLTAERMLAAALGLTEDPTTLIELHTARHAALFRLGRLAEADDAYDAIVRLGTTPSDRVEATFVQIGSLTNRKRPEEAVELGLGLMRELGWVVPASEQVNIEIDRELDWCSRWIDETSEADDLRRPDVTDTTVLAVGALISRTLVACFLRDRVTLAWLALAAARLWAEQGPTRTLLTAVGNLLWVLIGRRQDYRTGYRLMRRLLAVSDQRDYELDSLRVQFLHALSMRHWFEPLEEGVPHRRPVREGLVRGGDLQAAAYTFFPSVFAIDLFATLDDYAAEVDAGLAFAARTGNELAAGVLEPYRWLVAALRGEPGSADAAAMVDRLAGEPVSAANAYLARALAAALLDDPPSLAQHSQAVTSLWPAIEAMYPSWQAHLLRAIALAQRVRTTPAHAAELAELDKIIDWIAQRAADAPRNFRHMERLVEAERAWAVDDFRTAIHAFDAALRDAAHRPWHLAYIAERSARFMLAHSLDRAGWSLLAEAREAYRTWGARAKVDQLDRAFPSLEIPGEPGFDPGTRRSSITVGAIDMLAIVNASRALSSETGVGALREKVVEVLSGMTGATDVSLFVWSDEPRRWLAAADDHGGLAPLDQRHHAPDSVIRYVERTREPLIVGDATHDDRFARDPYFHGLDACSVLAAPVLSRGALGAILLLENRLIRDAFPTERIEGVMLIAGQLAVSLENALLYSSLERKVDERTEQLAHANERLAQLSVTDPLTGLANRRRLEDSLAGEWQRTQRTRRPLSLAMVDIDHFKQYNDRHGHVEGDQCLQRVAAELARTVRGSDLVARYGGEEFAVVMPHTDTASANEAAERIRLAINALAEPLTADQVVTVSVGVATVTGVEARGTDGLVERADGALYDAKRSGRNRVCTADTR
jgi:diguanylate cyclase (GGDEF)-like protein